MDIVTKTKRVLRTGNPQIYILKDSGNNALKIGFSIDFDKRLAHHSTANPFLKLVAIVPVQCQKFEYKLHKLIARFRIPNTAEWYSDSEALRNLLNTLFVSEGLLSEESIAISIKFLFDSNLETQNSVHRLSLSSVTYFELSIEAWLENKSLSKTAKQAIVEYLEETSANRANKLKAIGKRVNLTGDELRTAILDGRITTDLQFTPD
jgi:hypothetical protein